MSMFQSRTLWAVVVAAAPLAYVLCIKAAYDTSTTVSFAMDDGEGDDALNDDGSANYTDTVPAQSREEEEGDNDDNDGRNNTTSSWVVVRERVVSNPFTVTTEVKRSKEQVRLTTTTDLVNTYLGTTMRLFTYTPQAWLMRRMITDPEARRTFTASYLSACEFKVGDRVCGVYVVAERRRSSSQAAGKGGRPRCCFETVVLALAPPEGWKGPVVQGRLVAGLEEQEEANDDDDDDDDDDDESSVGKSKGLSTSSRTFRAVNETVLWRRREGEAPVFLEGSVGRWLHAFMVQWMVVKGVQAVLRER